jgi:hypothetical protein
VYACCGPSRSSRRSSPLVLGNVLGESLSAILDRGRRDPVLEALNRVGPYGVHQLLLRDPRLAGALRQRPAYTGMCELCLDLCNSPQAIEALRARLTEQDALALVGAARLMQSAAAQRHIAARQSLDPR